MVTKVSVWHPDYLFLCGWRFAKGSFLANSKLHIHFTAAVIFELVINKQDLQLTQINTAEDETHVVR